MACPKCDSLNVKRRFYVPVSKYGHLPTPPVDFCDDCGFKSQESFSSINFRHQRDYKLDCSGFDSAVRTIVPRNYWELIETKK